MDLSLAKHLSCLMELPPWWTEPTKNIVSNTPHDVQGLCRAGYHWNLSKIRCRCLLWEALIELGVWLCIWSFSFSSESLGWAGTTTLPMSYWSSGISAGTEQKLLTSLKFSLYIAIGVLALRGCASSFQLLYLEILCLQQVLVFQAFFLWQIYCDYLFGEMLSLQLFLFAPSLYCSLSQERLKTTQCCLGEKN